MVLSLGLLSVPMHAQLTIKNSEDVSINVGFEGQFWFDSTEDPTSQHYAQTMYMRRIRLILGGQLAKNVTFFFETDDPNLGKAATGTAKSLATGFLVQDAFLEWKISNHFRLDGGLIIVPFARQALQSTLSYYSVDISPISTVNNSSTQSSGLRDLGFQARGFFDQDRLQYRLGLFEGERSSTSRNSLRGAGYVQYDFFDKETNYTYVGTALGKQKILAVDGGFDKQGVYRSMSANVASDTPVHGGDEVGLNFQYIHYDGKTLFEIPDQNDSFLEAAYYVHQIKSQPYFKFEDEDFVTAATKDKDYRKVGGGVNFYPHGQNLKFTAQAQRVFPQNSPTKPSNEFTVQMQVFYY
jgi:hypothetical protein